MANQALVIHTPEEMKNLEKGPDRKLKSKDRPSKSVAIENPCDRRFVKFHGYTIFRDGTVFGKRGGLLKPVTRDRRGGGYDICLILYYRGKRRKWTLQRLVAACFLGPIDGYEINHKDRNPLNNHVDNLERVTPSENQKHWRNNGPINNVSS